MPFSPDTKFVFERDVRFRIIIDEAVVIRQESNLVYVINEVGGEILKHLKKGHSLGETCDAILAEYEVEAERLEGDVQQFLATLVEENILSPEDAP
jgi:hypothetical protein